MRYNDYLQALAQSLVDDLGVHVTVVTHERKEASQYHDHTPPNGRTLITIDHMITIDVSYKFISSWKLEGPAWYRSISYDTHNRMSGSGTFLHEAVNAWLAAQRIYDHLMTMDNLTMITPATDFVAAVEEAVAAC